MADGTCIHNLDDDSLLQVLFSYYRLEEEDNWNLWLIGESLPTFVRDGDTVPRIRLIIPSGYVSSSHEQIPFNTHAIPFTIPPPDYRLLA